MPYESGFYLPWYVEIFIVYPWLLLTIPIIGGIIIWKVVKYFRNKSK